MHDKLNALLKILDSTFLFPPDMNEDCKTYVDETKSDIVQLSNTSEYNYTIKIKMIQLVITRLKHMIVHFQVINENNALKFTFQETIIELKSYLICTANKKETDIQTRNIINTYSL